MVTKTCGPLIPAGTGQVHPMGNAQAEGPSWLRKWEMVEGSLWLCECRGCSNHPGSPSCTDLCGMFCSEQKESRFAQPKLPFLSHLFQEWALAVKNRVWPLAHISSWLKDRNLLYLFRDTPEVLSLIY